MTRSRLKGFLHPIRQRSFEYDIDEPPAALTIQADDLNHEFFKYLVETYSLLDIPEERMPKILAHLDVLRN